jgi:AmiR/NasT family two-component response regulator
MLQIALETNRDIGAAIGILMYEHKIDREAAWNLLRAVSQRTNHKVRDVAMKVIEAGTLP